MKQTVTMMVLGLVIMSMVPVALADSVGEHIRDVMKKNEGNVTAIREARAYVKAHVMDIKQKHVATKETLRKINKECKGNDTPECRDLRAQAKGHTREFLLAAADKMLNLLDGALGRVEGSNIPSEKKTEFVTKLQAKVGQVQAAKSVIEQLNQNSTREDFKEAAQVLKEAWSRGADDREGIKSVVQQAITHVAVERFGGVIKQTEVLKERLDRIKQNVNASDVNSSAFDAALSRVTASFDEAKRLLDAGEVPAAAQKMQEAKRHLQDARELLKIIVRDLKQKHHNADAEIKKAAKEVHEERVRKV